ncbi:hypothetical protein BH09PSE5_BH09PSE5_01080 [soil metagenome]
MKIKTQLVALVGGVVFPLVLLAGFVTAQLWTQQRQGYEQRFLERASAVRLAIDTEFDGIYRTLRVSGDATEIPEAEAEVVLRRRFRRLLDNNPDWAAVALTDAAGSVIMINVPPGTPVPPLLGLDDILRTMSSKTGSVSKVTATADGRHIVFVATAIAREGRTQGVIYAAIQHTHWLDLLRAYPVSERGTLTLMDGGAMVVTRTLNDGQWAGKRAPEAYWAKTVDKPSGAFRTTGIDGTSFYAAFSRSQASGWVLATGVPQDEVDEALHWPTLVVLLVAATAIFGALMAAWHLGRDISNSLVGLLSSANALAHRKALPDKTLPIREARAVRKALVHAHKQLMAREASLNASLEREAIARLQAESGSRAKDQFLAMMGHELRNPLSSITAAVELWGTGAVPRSALERSRDVVRRQAGHLASMINDLMDVAQLDSGEIVLRKTLLDLAQVAAKVLARFQETGRCTHLEMHVKHVPAWIEGDEARVELLITCLLDNACKYTPAGGVVTIEVSGEAASSVLRVRDTGAGIGPEMAGHMFDAFSQGARGIDRSAGGLGLGLALARKLVGLHGGAIEVSSEGQGLGSVFTVCFPSVDAPALKDAAVTPTAERDILLTIVEDIADNREVLTMLLEAQGRKINAAADGPSGLQMILDGPSDVAVVDIGLPGFDGMEVARRVRQAPGGDRIVLIALTGYGTDADRVKALAAGFDEFLVKPFDLDRFETALTLGLSARSVEV